VLLHFGNLYHLNAEEEPQIARPVDCAGSASAHRDASRL
jgi:hypothetical protein